MSGPALLLQCVEMTNKLGTCKSDGSWLASAAMNHGVLVRIQIKEECPGVHFDAFVHPVGATLTMTQKYRFGYQNSCCGSKRTVACAERQMRMNKLNILFPLYCVWSYKVGAHRIQRIEFYVPLSTLHYHVSTCPLEAEQQRPALRKQRRAIPHT
jgi:hypothetical protein